FLKARGELVGQYMPDKAVIRLYDKGKSTVNLDRQVLMDIKYRALRAVSGRKHLR
ncbi:unnamed protein product, partial [Pylaiella littoralis]